jgi:hypothetical protein
MAPVCILCKQGISLAYPGKLANDEWQHIPPCPKPALRTGRIARLWRMVTGRLRRRRLP